MSITSYSPDSPVSLSSLSNFCSPTPPPDSPLTPIHPSEGFDSVQLAQDQLLQAYDDGSWSFASAVDGGSPPLHLPSFPASACDIDANVGGMPFNGFDFTNPLLTVGELLKVVPDHPLPSTTNVKVDLSGPPKKTNATGLPFVQKLRSLLQNPRQFGDVLVWDQEGKSFIVSTASSRLIKDVLPKSFGHSNISSFNRQLNVYGFTRLPIATLFEKIDPKAPNTASFNGWYHKDFTRDSNAWVTMTPRPSRARLAKKVAREQEREQEKLELRNSMRAGR